jgi:hypothetical protein
MVLLPMMIIIVILYRNRNELHHDIKWKGRIGPAYESYQQNAFWWQVRNR